MPFPERFGGMELDLASVMLVALTGTRLEPEIVFKLKDATGAGLESVEWLAIGFEIIACPFPQGEPKFGMKRA